MSDLKQAISYIYDIEKNNYLLTRAIQQVDKELKQNYQNSNADFDFTANEPIYPKKEEFEGQSDKEIAIRFILGFVLGINLGNLVSGLLASWNSIIAIILGLACVPLGIFLIFGVKVMKNRAKEKEIEVRYKQELDRYHEQKREYKEQCDQYIRKEKRKYEQQNKVLRTIKGQLQNKLTASFATSVALYEMIGIDKKFRNIVPIAYMNEFLNLGIATKLEGADGLYYLTMRELKSDEMNRKLDEISYKLDSVINQQHSLYGELMFMNQKCDNLISQTISQTEALMQNNNLMKDHNRLMEQIENNTALAAYNSERIAREQEYMGYMARYKNW